MFLKVAASFCESTLLFL